MKKNKIVLLIVLALVILAVGLYLTNSSTTLRKSEADFAVEDTALVTKIFIADKNNNEVTLTRETSGIWMVNGEKAQPEKIRGFLKTLSDLKVRNPVPIVARNNVITRMATLAKKVEIYQILPRINLFNVVTLFPREKLAKTYYLGDVTPDNQGTFMLMEGSESPYVVHIPGFRGFVAARYSALDYEWRDYTVFNAGIGDIESVELEFPEDPEQSYRVELTEDRDVKLYHFGDPVPEFDTARILNFLTSFNDIRFEALLNRQIDQHTIDSVLSTRPRTVLRLTTREGDLNEVKIYYKKGFAALYMEDGAALEPFDLDRAYALVNDGKDFVLIQYFVFDKVTRTLAYLKGDEDN
jgi:hypothetical protein